MPVLRLIRERFERERPLGRPADRRLPPRHDRDGEPDADPQGRRRGGRRCAASNPLSTKDDVAAALVAEYGIAVLRPARRGPRHVLRATSTPSPTRTRSSRWTTAATSSRCSTRSGRARSPRSWPGPRRRRPASSGSRRWPPTARSRFPVVAVNEAQTKHLFDNRYGTGQSHGRRDPAGDEHPPRRPERRRRRLRLGRARGSPRGCTGMGAHVAVIEVDPVRALEALMDGFQVMTVGRGRRRGASCS